MECLAISSGEKERKREKERVRKRERGSLPHDQGYRSKSGT